MRTGKVVLGTAAGLAIGAITGILFAPGKGLSTRKQILNKGEDYADELKSFTEKFKSTKKDVEALVDKGKAKYDHDGTADIKHATS